MYKCLAADVPRAALYANRNRFEDQLIARNHRVTHLYLIHTEHHRNLAGMLQLLAEEDSTELCKSFDDEHPGHDRGAGVVPLEKNVIESDVFDANCFLIPHYFQNPIDQKHRIT